MATLYCTEHVHISQTQTQIPTPYFCVGQEYDYMLVSESVSDNVNEPLYAIKNIMDYELPQSGRFLRDSEDATRFSTKRCTQCIYCCCSILNEIQNESNTILGTHNEKRGLNHFVLSQSKKNGMSHLP